MHIRATVTSNGERERIVKKLSAVRMRSQLRGNKIVCCCSDDSEFCLGTTLLYIDTRNIGACPGEQKLVYWTIVTRKGTGQTWPSGHTVLCEPNRVKEGFIINLCAHLLTVCHMI